MATLSAVALNRTLKPSPAKSSVGFTIPAEGTTYCVGEAMQPVDVNEKDPTPEKTTQTAATLARNLAHLAHAVKTTGYPPGT